MRKWLQNVHWKQRTQKSSWSALYRAFLAPGASNSNDRSPTELTNNRKIRIIYVIYGIPFYLASRFKFYCAQKILFFPPYNIHVAVSWNLPPGEGGITSPLPIRPWSWLLLIFWYLFSSEKSHTILFGRLFLWRQTKGISSVQRDLTHWGRGF